MRLRIFSYLFIFANRALKVHQALRDHHDPSLVSVFIV